MKILVCDDKPAEGGNTLRAIEPRGDVTVQAGADLRKALRSFFKDVTTTLDGESTVNDELDAQHFAGYDLAIVDNNLTGLELDGARLTAEAIIGYLRAFTSIPYIVSLNKNLHVDFDLRFLFGDYQSLADLALNTGHLSHDRLWNAEPVSGFAPWYWPRLPYAAERRKEQEGAVTEKLHESVWKVLGFPPQADEYLSFRAKAALVTPANPVARETTFETFFAISRALAPAEKETLEAGKASGLARRAIGRVATYEVDRWLRRHVLGPQDVLIDLPHLLAQMPFLLGDRVSELGAWNAVARTAKEPFGLDKTVFKAHIEGAQFTESSWVPTPCFWWPSLKADERLTELYFDANAEWPDFVFCEDVSQFVPVAGTTPLGPPKEINTEIAGSWATRYAVVAGDYQYSPRSHIAGTASDS
ncbi:MAG: hypothetical protein OXH99_05780 [Bryobacterales bacterium]|nr:hypothetical protein [Bryobacterales bacterium]